MNYKAILKQKVQERSGEGKNGPWKIASYLTETSGMYPKRMVVDVSDGQMARVAQWDAMIGKNVEFQFEVDAHEWQGRWFNGIRAWGVREDIEANTAGTDAAGTAANAAGTSAGRTSGTAGDTAANAAGTEAGAAGSDDLPF